MQMQDYNSTILVNFTSTPGTYVLNRKKYAFAAAALCADFEHPGVYNPLLFDGQQCYEKDLLINSFIKDLNSKMLQELIKLFQNDFDYTDGFNFRF